MYSPFEDNIFLTQVRRRNNLAIMPFKIILWIWKAKVPNECLMRFFLYFRFICAWVKDNAFFYIHVVHCRGNSNWKVFFECTVFIFSFSQNWQPDKHHTDKYYRFYARIKTDISYRLFLSVWCLSGCQLREKLKIKTVHSKKTFQFEFPRQNII